MKKFLFLMLVFAVGAVGLFSQESISVSGNVIMSNRIHPEFESAGKRYLLVFPHFLRDGIEDNALVKVDGVVTKELPGRHKGMTIKEGSLFILVEQITVNGKVIDIKKNLDIRKLYNQKNHEKKGNNHFDPMKKKGHSSKKQNLNCPYIN